MPLLDRRRKIFDGYQLLGWSRGGLHYDFRTPREEKYAHTKNNKQTNKQTKRSKKREVRSYIVRRKTNPVHPAVAPTTFVVTCLRLLYCRSIYAGFRQKILH